VLATLTFVNSVVPGELRPFFVMPGLVPGIHVFSTVH
jgi:hypothetical protein